MGSFTHLLAGHDTVECAYYLHDLSAGEGVGLEALHAGKEAVRRKRRPKLVVLGGDEFYLFGHGTSSGYPFLLENANYSIGYGEFNMPSFFVTLRSEALWREGVVALHERFLTWAQSLGFQPARTETLSRVDFTFDYQIPEPDFDADSVVSLSAKDGTFRKDRREQTIQYGAGGAAMLRIYDKIVEINESSSKFWFRELWGLFEYVWRIEWQVRKEMLKRFAIRTVQDSGSATRLADLSRGGARHASVKDPGWKPIALATASGVDRPARAHPGIQPGRCALVIRSRHSGDVPPLPCHAARRIGDVALPLPP